MRLQKKTGWRLAYHRQKKSMRGTLRLLLVEFGLGALLIVFTLYIPTRQKLDKANAGIEYTDAVARQLAGQRVKRIRNEGI